MPVNWRPFGVWGVYQSERTPPTLLPDGSDLTQNLEPPPPLGWDPSLVLVFFLVSSCLILSSLGLLLFFPSSCSFFPLIISLSLITLVFCIVQTSSEASFLSPFSLSFFATVSVQRRTCCFLCGIVDYWPLISASHNAPNRPIPSVRQIRKSPDPLPYKRTGRPHITTPSLSTYTTHDTHERSNAGTLELHGRQGNSLPLHFFSFQVDPRPSLRVLALPCH